jgi:endonuclease G, mitochondrial
MNSKAFVNLHKKLILLLSVAIYINPFLSQLNTIEKINNELLILNLKKDSLNNILEKLILNRNISSIKSTIIPQIDNEEKLIEHSAIVLAYSEEHEQAKWVAHVINTNIIEGNVSRTNNFRKDPLVKTGSSEEKDFFTKTKLKSGKTIYDGYGYDRGHLAPSADFRWSKNALSESYFYSNMSPQLPEFNREGWAELENFLRSYIYENNVELHVLTGPILNDDLDKIDKSINQMSLPNFFYKIAIDFNNNRSIGFIMPNKKLDYPLEYYVTSIDSIESVSNLDFNYQLEDSIENYLERLIDISEWQTKKRKGNVAPISPNLLKKKEFNTVQAKTFANTGDKIKVCGLAVSTKLSKNGHTFINLDQSFPNQIFSATIWKSNSVNFSYQPHIELINKKVCFTGKVTLNKNTPTMDITNEKAIKILDN